MFRAKRSETRARSVEIAMRRRYRASVIAFSLFSLIGPLIYAISEITDLNVPVSAYAYPRPVEDAIYSVQLYTWPTSILSVGESINWRTRVDYTVANIVFFVVFGFLVGLMAYRAWVVTLLYVLTCASIMFLGVWGFRTAQGALGWCALVIVFLFYAIPFWVVMRSVKSSPAALGPADL